MTVLPDVLANAGGVTVSYFEWVQNRQYYKWSLDRVRQELDRVLSSAFEEMWTLANLHQVSLRTAAFMIGIERVALATVSGRDYVETNPRRPKLWSAFSFLVESESSVTTCSGFENSRRRFFVAPCATVATLARAWNLEKSTVWRRWLHCSCGAQKMMGPHRGHLVGELFNARRFRLLFGDDRTHRGVCSPR